MYNLFEASVKYQKVDEQSGKEKMVTERYLIDALSFTEAETRIYKEMEMMVRGEFTVKGLKKANYTEIFDDEDGDIWFKAKISFASVDEKTGREKKASNWILVTAKNVKDAYDKIENGMGGMTVHFEINSISETAILDFFAYFSEEGTEIPEHLRPLNENEAALVSGKELNIIFETIEEDESVDSLSFQAEYPINFTRALIKTDIINRLKDWSNSVNVQFKNARWRVEA